MIVAVTMVKDEADIIGYTLAHLLAEGVDHVIVADNLSTDATPRILSAFGRCGRVTVTIDDEVGYYQADKMTRLATQAVAMGADWVLPFDADELWYSLDGGTIADALDGLPGEVVKAYGWDHVATGADPYDPNPFLRMTWRRAETQKFPKVAFRAGADFRLHMGNHDIDRAGQRVDHVLAYRHFGFRSLPQMIAKYRNGARAYEATDLHEMYGAHWRRTAGMTDAEIAAEWSDLCATTDLVHDPAPYRD